MQNDTAISVSHTRSSHFLSRGIASKCSKSVRECDFTDVAISGRCGATLRASVPSADIKAELDFLSHVAKQAIDAPRALWHAICEDADSVLEPDEMPRQAERLERVRMNH